MKTGTPTLIREVLERHCGATPEEARRAVQDLYEYTQTEMSTPFEHRFCGCLGFGGKLRFREDTKTCYVDCYPEDATLTRQSMVKAANEELEELGAVV